MRIIPRTMTLLLLAALALMLSTPALAQISFVYPEVNGNSNSGFDDPTVITSDISGGSTTLGEERQASLEAAAAPWAAFLDVSQPVVISATMVNLGGNQTGAPLGAAGPNFMWRDFSGAPVGGTWFVDAQANQLAGSNNDPAVDIVAEFNSAVDNTGATDPLGAVTWYYGTDGVVPPGHIDFFSTALHELGHGLGFTSGIAQTGGLSGGFPVIYDRQLAEPNTSPAAIASMNDTQRAAAIVSGNLQWVGAEVVAAMGGNVPMYAPSPYEEGSSVSHWDTSVSPNELMEPFASDPFLDIGLEKKAFADMLWPIAGAEGEGEGEGEGENCNTYSSTNVPRAIDFIAQQITTSTLSVAESVAIADVNVTVNITYPFVGDLTIQLQGPTGLTVLLASNVGGNSANFTSTAFDDQAATAISAGSAPYTGSFQPAGNLSAFNGTNANGTWTLRVQTDDFFETGSLTAWSIEVCASTGGEGEGEGETTCSLAGPCPDFDAEGATLYGILTFDYLTADLDLSGIPDSFEVALFEEVLCGRTGALHDETVCAFVANLDELRAELFYPVVASVENVVAATLTLSSESQAAVKSALNLNGNYTVVGGAAKAAGEPLSPQGDPDADGLSNKEEYDNTVLAGFGKSEYVIAALSPILDGSTDPADLPTGNPLGMAMLAGLLAAMGTLLLLIGRGRLRQESARD